MDLRSGTSTGNITPVNKKRTFEERDSPDLGQGLTKHSVMAEITDEDMATLKKQQIPQWGLSLIDILNKTLSANVTKSVTESVTLAVQESFRKELKTEIEAMEAKFESDMSVKCEKVLEKCDQKIEKLSNRVDLAILSVEGVQEHIRSVDIRVTDELVKQEDYSRRNNLRFSGFDEAKDEKFSDRIKMVRGQIAKIKNTERPNLKDCAIERCHRVGKFDPSKKKTRDILVKFLDWNDRQAVSDGRDAFDEGIHVKADHALAISNANRALKPILKAVEGTPYGAKGRVRVQDGFVIVDHRRYSLRNLYALPKGVNYYLGNHVTSESSLSFFGILSPFSNFHWCPFTVNDQPYVCSEQFITAALAREFQREDIYKLVMALTDPYQMKKLAYKVKESPNFKAKDWEDKVPEVAYVSCQAKFSQNKHFGDFLLDTGDKTLGEACEETPWGCGLKLSNPDIKDPKKWKRNGAMGDALMRVRSELRLERQMQIPFASLSPVRRSSASSQGSKDSDMDTSHR